MRTATTITALLLLPLTAACSSDDSSSDSKATPTASSSTSPKQKFLADVRAAEFASWADARPTNEELLEFPPEWCTELKAGHSVEYVFDDFDGAALYPSGMDWGTELADANQLLVLGVTAYCPDLREQVTKDLRENGGY
ncbi:hypothetical protein LHJ74_14570 [Streptomyces sp. N2-109]|uniref:Lipoprotein n=1 Tax=Streptomyces gossypii TaxID=2883101 RepID=A0ABT2JT97_9ACTN|nr:hypothetical protein [Streptomyces gossypii]MCT2591117.1 hypothetical protein [Streptomyces gossypii]